MQQPTNVVVPASLQDNYKKELNKWVGGQPDYMNVQSQQRVGRNGLHQGNNKGLLIVDEAHRARDTQSSLLNALKQSQAKKRLLLTATPVYNHLATINSTFFCCPSDKTAVSFTAPIRLSITRTALLLGTNPSCLAFKYSFAFFIYQFSSIVCSNSQYSKN
jgi:hypothetical protein